MGRSSSSCNTLRPTRKHWPQRDRSRDRLALGHRHHGPTCECAVDRILKINFVDTNYGRCPSLTFRRRFSTGPPWRIRGSGQNENVSGGGHACHMSRSQSTHVDINPASGPWFLTEAPPVHAGSQALLR
jgi:hypothetical protein